MKKILFLFLLLAALVPALRAQPAQIQWMNTLPVTCQPDSKRTTIVYKFVVPRGLYYCSAINTWTSVGAAPATEYRVSTFGSSLNTAVTALGATNADLIIDSDAAATTVAVPANVRVVFRNNSVINAGVGQTVTINNIGPVGNQKIFTGSGTFVLTKISTPVFNLAWWAGTDTSIDATSAINAALANLSTNGGGVLYVPNGAWKTTGGHIVPSNVIIEGAGKQVDATTGSIFLNTNNAATFMFKASEAFRHITFKDLTINISTGTTTKAFWAFGTFPNTAVDLEFDNVHFYGGLGGTGSILTHIDSSTGWEVEGVKFDHCSWNANGIAYQSDTANQSVTFIQPWFFLGAGATGMKLVQFASTAVYNPLFSGVTGYLTATDALQRTITQASITSGTKNLSISTGAFTQNDVGQKVVIAGKLNSYIDNVVSSITATVHDNATSTAVNSAMDVSRWTPNTGMAKAAIWITNNHGNISVEGGQDEGLQYFLIVDVAQNSGVIQLTNNFIQSQILLNASCTINSSGNRYGSGTFQDALTDSTRVGSNGDYVSNLNGALRTLTNARLYGERLGGLLITPNNPNIDTSSARTIVEMPFWIKHAASWGSAPDITNAVLQVGSAIADKPLLRIGALDQSTDDFVNYYTFTRSSSTGFLGITGSQGAPFVGYTFDAGVTVTGTVTGSALTTAGILTANSAAITTTASVADDPYASGWNGSTNVPTKNAVFDQLELYALWNTVPKVSDQTKTANTTLAADSALTFNLVANKTYSVEIEVFFDTTAAGDFKYSLTGPASPTLVRVRRAHVIPGTTADVVAIDVAYTASTSVAGTGTTGGWLKMTLTIQNGANAGAFAFNWAQDTSDAGNTIVRAGSYLRYRQVN